ncbi:MAG: tetratricopeptide (TPR) repeat protein [Crocinitomicaceae bacterium]|jgi:tetratricopeptide (TPR) repeat protein
MGLNKYILLLAIAFISTSTLYSQKNSGPVDLKKLNDEAFFALENNEDDVVEKARYLVEQSKIQKSGVYESNGYTILGIINKNKGYYITSVDHYIKALNAAEKIKDPGRVSASYNNIGTVYQLQENYTKALEYFQQSLNLEEKLNNPLQKSIRLYNIGEVYSELDSMDLALTYFNNSLLIEKKYSNNEGIIYALLGIAEVYLRIDRLTDASITLNKSSEILDPINVELRIIYYKLTGELYGAQKNYANALKDLGQAEDLSNTEDYRVHLLDIYITQINLLNAQQQWEKSVDRYKKYVKLKNELNSIKVKNQLEDLTHRNELKQKELKIELANDERDLAQKNVKIEESIGNYESRIIWFLIFTIVLILGLIVYGIKRITKGK